MAQELIVLEKIYCGQSLSLAENKNEICLAEPDNGHSVIGIASRDIQEGEIIAYDCLENTNDIIVKTNAPESQYPIVVSFLSFLDIWNKGTCDTRTDST